MRLPPFIGPKIGFKSDGSRRDAYSIVVDGGDGSKGDTASDLPGLRLVDLDISNLQGQIIHLDFDGEQNVTYNGPVTVGPFDVPAFQAPNQLAGQKQIIIDEVLAILEETFAGSGIIFTAQRPEETRAYSTIYIGGGDSAFSPYGSFLGLAEEVDVGNCNLGDRAFVFSDQIAEDGAANLPGRLAQIIAHEVGHLLGYKHKVERIARGGPSAVSSNRVS
jgi:hypothetical protein